MKSKLPEPLEHGGFIDWNNHSRFPNLCSRIALIVALSRLDLSTGLLDQHMGIATARAFFLVDLPHGQDTMNVRKRIPSWLLKSCFSPRISLKV